jgi:hypothetical protein
VPARGHAQPAGVDGRKYVAIVVPPTYGVTVVSLLDSARHQFASAESPMPGSGTGTLPMGQ